MRTAIASALTLALLLLLVAFSFPTPAAAVTFNVSLDGSQEVGGGDPTGTGSGTITLDPVADMISWNINYQDLDDPSVIYPISLSGWHIHGPGGSPGNTAAVLVNLGNLGASGIPNGNLSAVIAANSATIDAILANPSDFYLNLHTSDEFGGQFAGFPLGAIRGQLPEPHALFLLATGLGALALRRRT